MKLRVFRDPEGTEWRAWDCTSTNIPGLLGGWLCFESATEKRRLLPIPRDWETAPEERLARLCRMATPVRRTIEPSLTGPAPSLPGTRAA